METKPFDTIGIVGAGTMGAQISLLCAAHGRQVWLWSRSEQTLQRAAQFHVQDLEKRRTPEAKSTILDRIHLTTYIQEVTDRADLVIENVPEVLSVKREMFALLDRTCLHHTILATNSSSLCISAIEDVTRRRESVLNLHFVSPVWDGSCAELMCGTVTSDETIARVRQLVRSLGLTPLLVRKESTGFILGRVWRAVKKEALDIVEEGVASHEDVDRGWMIAFGTPIGPFGLIDLIGLDVVRDVEMTYYRKSGDVSDAPPKILLDRIEQGELGVKTGKGFYNYPNPAFQIPGWLKGDADEASR